MLLLHPSFTITLKQQGQICWPQQPEYRVSVLTDEYGDDGTRRYAADKVEHLVYGAAGLQLQAPQQLDGHQPSDGTQRLLERRGQKGSSERVMKGK